MITKEDTTKLEEVKEFLDAFLKHLVDKNDQVGVVLFVNLISQMAFYGAASHSPEAEEDLKRILDEAAEQRYKH